MNKENNKVNTHELIPVCPLPPPPLVLLISAN